MNDPADPWTLLELDRTTAGAREVKRAYARLLKQHRPDQDPEGFRRVNDAYQTALAELEQGVPDLIVDPGTEHRGDESVKVGEPVGQRLPGDALGEAGGGETQAGPDKEEDLRSGPVPPAFREVDAGALEVFSQARDSLLKRLAMVSPTKEIPEFIRLRNLVREHPALADRWVELMSGHIAAEAAGQIIYQLHAEDVWLLMREGQGQFAAGVVLQWRQDAALLGRVKRLGLLLLEETGEMPGDHPARLQALHFVATVAAFYLPDVSAKIADELYRQMEPGARDRMVREIEIRSAAGRAFSILALPAKQFWEYQLFEAGADETVDWSEPHRLEALRQVVETCPPDWEGWGAVRHVVPEAVLDASVAQRRRKTDQTALKPESPWWQHGGKWTGVFAFVFMKVLMLAFGFSGKPEIKSERESNRGSNGASTYQERLRTGESPADRALKQLDEIRIQRPGAEEAAAPLPPPGSRVPDRIFRTQGLSPSPGDSTRDQRFRLD